MESENKENICNICFDEINNKLITKCNHEFCSECIERWVRINNNCPLCRSENAILICKFCKKISNQKHKDVCIDCQSIVTDIKFILRNKRKLEEEMNRKYNALPFYKKLYFMYKQIKEKLKNVKIHRMLWLVIKQIFKSIKFIILYFVGLKRKNFKGDENILYHFTLTLFYCIGLLFINSIPPLFIICIILGSYNCMMTLYSSIKADNPNTIYPEYNDVDNIVDNILTNMNNEQLNEIMISIESELQTSNFIRVLEEEVGEVINLEEIPVEIVIHRE